MEAKRAAEKEPSVLALAVVLQHPALTADPQNVCRLLQVCKAWRAAVQQSAACTTILRVTIEDVAKVARLGSWLPACAGMVCDVAINMPFKLWFDRHGRRCWSAADRSVATTANIIIAMSLQLARTGIQCAAAATTTGTTGMLGGVALLQLQRFSSDIMHSAAVLSALPAASLTKLELTCIEPETVGSASVAAALARLTGLKQLVITSACLADALPSTWMSALNKLTRLAHLTCTCFNISNDTEELPPSLRKLVIDVTTDKAAGTVVGLRHLTCLEELSLTANHVAAGSSLPSQLQSISILRGDRCKHGSSSILDNLSISSVQQLQRLSLIHTCATPEQLQLLTALTALQDVSLEYDMTEQAVVAAPAWQQLPLLHLDFGIECVQPAQIDIILRGVEAATSVTCLKLYLELLSEEGQMLGGLQVCSHLSGLKQLKELALYLECDEDCMANSYRGLLAMRDALHLTNCTALTKLDLGGLRTSGVDDVVGVALACALTQLRYLDLQECGLSSLASLPAIGRLTSLQELYLLENYGVDSEREAALMMLTGLRQLKGLDLVKTVPADVAERFWAAVRG